MAKGPTLTGREEQETGTLQGLSKAGRAGWAFVGVVAALAVIGYLASRLTVVIVPVVLALFPATLLAPVAKWLKRRGFPAALAAIATVVTGILLIGGLLGALVPVFAAQAPEVVDAASEGMVDLQNTMEQTFGIELPDPLEMVSTAEGDGSENEMAEQAIGATAALIRTLTAVVLLVVALFFYLKDGRRLVNGALGVLPERLQGDAAALAERSWVTLGAYFRGQLLVALVDAVFIGIGLVIVGVPLAFPLSVLTFFGGLFPIVGAVTTGGLAVLVALADQGLGVALVVLAIVIGVQQVEGNVLAPVILGRAINLHPFIVLLSITAGALLLGILGAFLAVPVAAVIDQAGRYVREQPR